MSEWLSIIHPICTVVAVLYAMRARKLLVRGGKCMEAMDKAYDKLILENEKLGDDNKNLRHELLVLKTRNVHKGHKQ